MERKVYSFSYSTPDTNITGYIGSFPFTSEVEMEDFLEGYYGESVIFTEEENPSSVLTDEELMLLIEGHNPFFSEEWMKGRVPLFEWGTEKYPDGQEITWSSGRQPRKLGYV